MTKYSHEELVQRFNERVDKAGAGGCWLWKLSTNRHGYGQWRVNGKRVTAHQWSYETFVGPRQPGMHVAHLCDVKRCANPDHLEMATPSKNTADAYLRGLFIHPGSRKTHCLRGHELPRTAGKRGCRECEKIRRSSDSYRQKAKERNKRYREKKLADGGAR